MRKLLFFIGFMLFFNTLSKAQEVLKVGDTLTNMVLKNINGEVYNLNQQKSKGFIIVFMTPSCDHCLAYVNRVLALNKLYKPKGYPIVAIGPYGDNEKDYPHDALPAMSKLSLEKGFTFPYLSDEKFRYTWLFNIRQTPKAVILKKLKESFLVTYIGNIDNEPNEQRVATMKYVEDEVDKLLGKSVQ